MNVISAFVVGERYTNDQIRYTLNLENLGGIRPSVGSDGFAQHLALMTATETSGKRKNENPYHDRIEGNILIYTGTGRIGDHSLAGKNKRLTEQYNRPVPFYGFINEGRQIYQFLGLLELLRHYPEQQIDTTGQLRTAWVFEFLIHRQPDTVPVELAATISAQIISESRRNHPVVAKEREVVTNVQLDTQELTLIQVEELRAQLLEVNPYRFEHLVKDVLSVSGFRNVSVTKASGDGGVDVNAYVEDISDFFGGTHVQFQAKRWRHSVGSVEINSFRGALNANAKGVFITTSHYTKAAIEDSCNPMKSCITLIDGRRFATILRRSGVAIANYL